MATAFDADYGVHQGRIPSATAAAGDYVLELGHALPDVVRRFNPNDRHLVTQTADLTGVKSLLATLVLRGVGTMPAGATWTARMLVDAVVRTSRVVDLRDRRLVEFGVNVSNLTGNHAVAFDLTITGGSGPYDAELPGASVDAVVVDEVGLPLVLLNRDPEPGETHVPLAGPFRFQVENTVSAAAVDVARTDVYVDGVLVCAGGVFQAGWTSSSRTGTVTNGWAFVLNPDAPLTSAVAHTVRVVSALTGGPAAELDSTWSFTTIDVIAPVVAFAFATSLLEVRVGFGEAVLQLGDGSAGDALDPAAYTLELVEGAPAVVPRVVAVAAETTATVLLTLDKPATRRAVYRVTVAGVADLAGNETQTPTNVALFEGFVFPVPGDRDFEVWSLWSEDDRIQDEKSSGDLRKLSAVLQEVIDLLLYFIDKWGEILDPDTAPEPFLDVMLKDMGNPFRFALTVIEKRRLAQILVDIYRRKGTGPGIVDTIRLFMGLEVTINVPAWSPVPVGEAIMEQDWILGSNDLQDILTFHVVVPVQLTEEERRKMRALVDYMMAEREFFEIVEPAALPPTPDHWTLGFSLMGFQTFVH